MRIVQQTVCIMQVSTSEAHMRDRRRCQTILPAAALATAFFPLQQSLTSLETIAATKLWLQLRLRHSIDFPLLGRECHVSLRGSAFVKRDGEACSCSCGIIGKRSRDWHSRYGTPLCLRCRTRIDGHLSCLIRYLTRAGGSTDPKQKVLGGSSRDEVLADA